MGVKRLAPVLDAAGAGAGGVGMAGAAAETHVANGRAAIAALAEAGLEAAAAVVRAYQDLLLQERYEDTEPLFAPALVADLTVAGRWPFGDLQRRRARLIGGLSDYRLIAARARSCPGGSRGRGDLGHPAEALVDVDSFWGGIKWEETFVVVDGPDGWRIAGAFWRNALG